jgi:hypothetical protein
MKENLAKLFYDMAKIVFGTAIVVPIVQDKMDQQFFLLSSATVIVSILIGIAIDLSGGEK